MHYYEQLFHAKRNKRCGNHSVVVEYDEFGKKQKLTFYYYEEPICYAYPRDKFFALTDGGYNTPSTHKAIGIYWRYFTSMNYTLFYIEITGEYANRFLLK